MSPRFQYGTAQVQDLKVVTGPHQRSGLPTVTHVELEDRRLQPTPRFWRSFFGRFHISDNTFRYFSHAEVFERVSQRGDRKRFRINRV